MGTFSIWHWIIVLIIVLLLFGKGKIPSLMADMAKGIKSFKTNMAEDEKPAGESSIIGAFGARKMSDKAIGEATMGGK